MTELSKPTFLLLGEAVVDMISTGILESLEDATNYHRFAGGQVSNLAMNLSRLGFSAKLGACVGEDGFGRFLQDRYTEAGVNLDLLQTTTKAPTTLIPISRQTKTPDFSVYRGADRFLSINSQLQTTIDQVQGLHTSAFALSQDPCRSTILNLIKSARENGTLITLDPNYHPGIWPDIPNYKEFLQDVFQYISVTKPSLEDSVRFFGTGFEPADYLEKYLELGPSIVVLTLGDKGVYLGTQEGGRLHIKANQVPVKDVTGAGDAFWSGLLVGLLEGKPPAEAAKLGQVIAEFKIGIIGPVKQFLTWDEFDKRASQIQTLSLSQ